MRRCPGVGSFADICAQPAGSGARTFTEEEVDYFKSTLLAHDINPVVVHIPYISNPAAAKDDLYELAHQVVKEDLQRCSLVGADYLVLHPVLILLLPRNKE